MTAIVQRLDRFWFVEASPRALAALRILVGGYALWYVAGRYSMLLRIADSSVSMFEPVGVATLLPSPLPVAIFQTLLCLTLLLNVLFLLGWGYRLAGPAFALLLLALLCYRNSWSMIYHSDNLLVLHVLILAFSPAADALSLDTLARRMMSYYVGGAMPPVAWHWRYGWPVRLMCTTTALTYLLAGVAKLAGPLGWSWVSGQALHSQLLVDTLRKQLLAGESAPLPLQFIEHDWLLAVLAVLTLAFEIVAPLALAHRRTAQLWAVAAIVFHWSIFLVMGIQFRYHMNGIAFASHFAAHRPAPAQQSAKSVARSNFDYRQMAT